jgi:ribonuclease P protein component
VLAVDHRLRDSDSFRRTVRSGRRAGGAALVTYLRVGEPDGGVPEGAVPEGAVRVGFVVSKAVGGSVVRNRVRRRLRHLVRSHLSSLPAGAELVVRALPPAAELDSTELDAELARCLERVLRLDPAATARTGAPS